MKLQNIVTGMQHIGISTGEIEKTVAFYTALGFHVSLRTENKDTNKKVAFLNFENLTIETYEEDGSKRTSGAIDHIALDVSDIEAAFQIMSEAGYISASAEIQFLPFWVNGVRFFTIEGPNKEKIEFNQKL